MREGLDQAALVGYHETIASLAAQAGVGGLTAADVARATTRNDLGISSLQVILAMVTYCDSRRDVTFRPEWVARLEEVDGMVAVLREIDELALAPAGAP